MQNSLYLLLDLDHFSNFSEFQFSILPKSIFFSFLKIDAMHSYRENVSFGSPWNWSHDRKDFKFFSVVVGLGHSPKKSAAQSILAVNMYPPIYMYEWMNLEKCLTILNMKFTNPQDKPVVRNSCWFVWRIAYNFLTNIINNSYHEFDPRVPQNDLFLNQNAFHNTLL